MGSVLGVRSLVAQKAAVPPFGFVNNHDVFGDYQLWPPVIFDDGEEKDIEYIWTDMFDSPPCTWTDENNEVLVLRCINPDGKSYSGFPNPIEPGSIIEAPEEWNPEWGAMPPFWRGGFHRDNECGGGIHGWAWGKGVGLGKIPEETGIWQIYAVDPQDVVWILDSPKCKFRRGRLIFSGISADAFYFCYRQYVRMIHYNCRKKAEEGREYGNLYKNGRKVVPGQGS
jgi:hypothetical protein